MSQNKTSNIIIKVTVQDANDNSLGKFFFLFQLWGFFFWQRTGLIVLKYLTGLPITKTSFGLCYITIVEW